MPRCYSGEAGLRSPQLIGWALAHRFVFLSLTLTRRPTHVFFRPPAGGRVTPTSSFRRRPESTFDFIGWASATALVYSWCFSRQPTHVPVFFRPPSWRSGHFLLLVQEKVTKE